MKVIHEWYIKPRMQKARDLIDKTADKETLRKMKKAIDERLDKM